MTPEVEHLLRELDRARKGALQKLDGLSEEDARRSTVDSGTNLAGLIQHLTFVESMWFEQVVGGRTPHGIRSMQVDPSVTLRQLRAAAVLGETRQHTGHADIIREQIDGKTGR